MLRRILYWTGGHPYLTQRLCQAVAASASDTTHPSPLTTHQVDTLCEELFLSTAARRRDDNLLFVRERMLRGGSDLAAVLELYRRLYPRGGPFGRGPGVRDDERNPLVEFLRLAGIASGRDGRLRVRNRIYARAFDRRWIAACMPDAEVRRQRAAFVRGAVRAGAAAGVVVLLMGGLANAALDQAGRARRSALQLQRALDDLKRSNWDLKFSQAEATRSGALAVRKAGDAETARGLAVRSQGEAERQRRIAENRRKEAQEQGANATVQSERSHRMLVGTQLAEGHRLAEEGDLFGALLPFSEALRLDQGHPERASIHRLRLASVLSRVPRTVRTWFHSSPVLRADTSPDGLRFLTVTVDGLCCVWDVRSERPRARRAIGPGTAWATSMAGGAALVFRSKDGVSRVWDLESGRPAGPPLDSRPAQVTSAAFSPDGTRVVTGLDTGMVRIWDRATGKGVTTTVSHGTGIHSVCFSPDEQRVAAAYDAVARVWDAHSGKPVTPQLNSQGWITALAFSPDGSRLLAGGHGTAQLWDTRTGHRVGRPLAHDGVTCAVFSRDGKKVATGAGTVCVWDTETGLPLTLPMQHGDRLTDIRFSPDELRLVTSSLNRTARVWDARTGRPLTPPLRHTGGVLYAAFVEDGRSVLTAGSDGTARLWDTASTRRTDRVLSSGSPARTADLSPDGSRAVTVHGDGTARLWDLERPERAPAPVGSRVRCARFTPDGKYLATGTADGAVSLRDPRGGSILQAIPVGASVKDLGFDSAATCMTVSSDSGPASIWRLNGGRPPGPAQRLPGIPVVLASPDGSRFITLSPGTVRYGAARIRSLRSPGFTLPHGGDLDSACFNPEGTRALTVGKDGSAAVWRADTGRPAGRIGVPGGVASAGFSPDRKWIATISSEGTVQLWHAGTLRAARRLPITASWARALAFSRDGRLLAVSELDGRLGLFDPETGERVMVPLNAGGRPELLVFSADNRRLLSVETERRVSVWDLPVDNRPAADLSRLAQALSGQRLNRLGQRDTLSPRELEAAFRFLYHRYPADFKAAPGADLEWEAQAAQSAQAAGDWKQAVTYLDRLLVRQPEQGELYRQRGHALAELGQWERARADFGRAPEVRDRHYNQALTCLAAGDLGGYRRGCEEMLERYEASTDPADRDRTTWTCALAPAGVKEPERALRLSRKLVELEPGNPGRLQTLGALQYRSGRFEEAARTLDAAVAARGSGRGEALDYLFLALVHARSGDSAAAREHLAAAEAWIEAQARRVREGSEPGPRWVDRVELTLLLDEARSLVETPETPTGKPDPT